MDFHKIAKNIIEQSGKSIETRLCPDQYVGKINGFKKCQDTFPERMPVKDRPKKIKCLIMILESPHTEEFKNELGPAKGTTGKLIREHILSVKGLCVYRDYGLILINAIQNQCSLGHPTDCFRDQVFISAWDKGAKKQFIERLKSVYLDGDVIVNCCTKGKAKKHELRKLVQAAIPSELGNVLRRTHPSSWYSRKNRDSEWKA